jgi:hypothetical protein
MDILFIPVALFKYLSNFQDIKRSKRASSLHSVRNWWGVFVGR